MSRISDDCQLQHAKTLMELGEEYAAMKVVESVYDRNLEVTDGYVRLGCAKATSADWESAHALMRRDHELGRMSPVSLMRYAEAKARSGDQRGAVHLIELAYQQDHSLRDGFSRLGGIKRERGEWEAARDLIARDVSTHRISDEWLLRYAEVLMELQDGYAATEIVESTYKRNEEVADGYARLGWVRARSNDWQNAHAMMARDHDSGRMSPVWCVHYAQVKARCGDQLSAVQLIEYAYAQDTGLCDGFARLGWQQRTAGRWDSARLLMNRDYEQGRISVPFTIRLSKLLAEFGEVHEAKLMVLKIVDLSAPNALNVDDYILASQILFFMHAYRSAKETIQKAISQFPNSIEAIIERQRQDYVRATLGWLGLQDATGIALDDSEDTQASEYSWNNIIKNHQSISAQRNPIPYDAHTYVTQSILHESDRHLHKGDIASAKQVVYNSVAILGGNLNATSIHQLVEPVLATEIRARHLKQQRPAIRKYLDKMHGVTSCLGWLFVYDFLVWHGHFELALVAWQEAIQSAYLEASANPYDENTITRAARASIIEANFVTCDRLLERLRLVNKDAFFQFDAYAALNRGDTHKVIAMRENQATTYGDSYHDLISGKSVAIVGPAPTEELCGEEIDSFDIVVRFCHNGTIPNTQNSQEFGRNTNVSYYAKNTFFGWDSETRKHATNDLDFYLLDNIDPGCLDFINDVARGRAGLSQPNSRMFHKYPNAMQRILFDVVRYNPARIKLFKTNFYFSSIVYRKEHRDIVTSTLPRQKSGLVRHQAWAHDFLSQLGFVRNLFQSGIIEVDETCRKVLLIPNELYVKQMEVHHGYQAV